MNLSRELTVLDYIRIAWRGRQWLGAWLLVSMLLALLLAQLQPRVFGAKVTMLPPRENAPQSLSASLGAALMGGGGGKDGGLLSFPALLGGGVTFNSSQDMIVALLRSRTLRNDVLAEAAKTWGSDVGSKIVLTKPDLAEKGVIGFVVEAKDPKLAAQIANTYVAQLDRLLQRFGEQTAQRRQSAYAVQLEKAAKGVEAAEDELLKFQAENRVLLNLDAPTKGALDTMASLRGTIMSLEMQREVMRLRYTDQHPQMREIEKQISELKSQYSKSLFGGAMDLPPESPAARGTLRKEFFVPAAKLTPVQFSLLKLYRNVKMQEAFYTGALQGLQQLQYGVDENAARIELLDPAEPNVAPVRPNIPFIVMAGAVAGLVLGLAFIFIREFLRLARIEERERTSEIAVLHDERVEARP
jgi:uncharacterized protein involved in exopolysaccharide biosynthesis